MGAEETDAVRDALARFQDGYTRRDVATLDAFMQLWTPGDAVEFIGTEARRPGDFDWGSGREGARRIVEWDWRYWYDVRIDVSAARITVHGDVAWLAAPVDLMVSERARAGLREALEREAIARLRDAIADDAEPAEERVLRATLYGQARLRERTAPLGSLRPLTLTAVLVRVSGDWRFAMTHWAHAAD